jgi:acyl-CoA synthetase (NDP forming)
MAQDEPPVLPRDLSRLLRPASVAVMGGAWATNVIKQLQKANFSGDLWPVHPRHDDILGVPCYASLQDLPGAPDACFIGVNRELTIESVRQLSALGAGGAVCFASGFLESEADSAGGAALQEQLLEAAGDMPVLGPNCYGLLNYIDNVPLWPDEHGGVVVDRGVAIIAQSSNIAINLSMQRRGLPLAYVVTAGNQAQTDAATIAETLLRDRHVSALGFYLEGFGDIRSLERVAALARTLGKPLLALKSGKTSASQAAALSHTASLAGSSAASEALLRRLGITEVGSLDVFLETLKILHFAGPLASRQINSVSCSGGEAALMADGCAKLSLEFPAFSTAQRQALLDCLGPLVNIANPLDYHTYIWGDVAAMTRCFTAVCSGETALNIFVIDLPRDDRCDPSGWECAIEALAATRKNTGAPIAVLTGLTDNMDEALAERLIALDCLPLGGMQTGLCAVDAAARAGSYLRCQDEPAPLLLAPADQDSASLIGEYEAKRALADFGVEVPTGVLVDNVEQLREAASTIRYPCVLKAQGLAHKSESGAVALRLADAGELLLAAAEMATRLGGEVRGFLAESMVEDTLAELLVGITRDNTGLFLLTLGWGGTLTELVKDSVTLLLPCSRAEIEAALKTLRVYPLITGYRGAPAADRDAVLSAIVALCDYARVNAGRLVELEINPLLLSTRGAVAADALLRLADDKNDYNTLHG